MSYTTLKGFKDEINFDKINISSLRKLDSGGQMSAVSYGEQNNKFIIQTPLMSIPYAFGTGYNGERSDYMTLSLGDYSSDDKLNKFYENMKNIEESVLQHVVKNVDTWFPNFSGKSEAVIEQLIGEAFNRFIKHSKDDKYPPTIKVKIPYDNGKYDINIVDMNTNEKYDFNEIKDKLRGAYVKICFRISSVYFINKHFGISAKASKIKISFPAKDEDDFRSDSEDESSVIKKMSSAVIEDDEIDDEIRKEASKKTDKTDKTEKTNEPKDSEEEEEEKTEEKEDSDDDDDNSDDSDEPVKKPAVIKKTQVKSKVSKKK
ncbi:hypothetical protein OAA30_00325 [bacterium]|jgi:hypothetical protein|nr:hypothetical protein [bacterium]